MSHRGSEIRVFFFFLMASAHSSHNATKQCLNPHAAVSHKAKGAATDVVEYLY